MVVLQSQRVVAELNGHHLFFNFGQTVGPILNQGGWCDRQESNLYCELRRLVSYPLEDGRVVKCRAVLTSADP